MFTGFRNPRNQKGKGRREREKRRERKERRTPACRPSAAPASASLAGGIPAALISPENGSEHIFIYFFLNFSDEKDKIL